MDGQVQVVYGTQNWNTTYRGVAPNTSKFASVRFRAEPHLPGKMSRLDVPVCILGQTVVQNLFANEDPVGKSIRVQAMPCRVIGMFSPKERLPAVGTRTISSPYPTPLR